MLVSVVMSVYNGEKYVVDSINSILNQSYQDFEFIIVNDGSKDKTKRILDKIRDKRVKVIHLKKNQGLAQALNIGIGEAKGKYIIRHDADDLSLPQRIERQLAYIQSHPELVVLGTQIKTITDQESTPDINKKLREIECFHNNLLTREQLETERFRSCFLPHGSCLFVKESFIKAGKYNPRFEIVQDYDLWMRMFEQGSIKVLPEVLYQYRIHPHSLSQQSQVSFSNEMNHVSLRYIHKQIFAHKQKPSFIVFGPHANCRNFKNNVLPKSRIRVYDYFPLAYLKQYTQIAAWLCALGRIDGVIVLDTGEDGVQQALDLLQNATLVYNQNLFSLYNVI